MEIYPAVESADELEARLAMLLESRTKTLERKQCEGKIEVQSAEARVKGELAKIEQLFADWIAHTQARLEEAKAAESGKEAEAAA